MKKLILSLLVMTSLMLMVVGSVSAEVSTYEITQTGLADSYEVRTLVDASTIELVIANEGIIPIEVTLATLVSGDSGYDHVRINPVNAGEHIQLWAEDELNNWYDINVVGWGPLEGFPLPINYSAATWVYIISDAGGTYTLNVQLVDVDTSMEITSNSEEVYVDGEGPSITGISVNPEYPQTIDLVTICADVTDISGVDSVKLTCTASNDAGIINQPMIKTDNTYCGSAYVLNPDDGTTVDCSITATDKFDNPNTENVPQFVFDGENPIADADGPYSCDEGGFVSLDASLSVDSVDDLLDYAWDLNGDGIYDDSFVVNPDFDCVDDGTYDVSVEVTDDAGFTNTADSTVTVINVNPVAIISGDTTGDEGSDITLTASETDVGTLDTHIFAWNLDNDGEFDDGTNNIASIHCVDEELITVLLKVTDDDLGTDTKTHTVQCQNVNPTIDAGTDQTVNQGDLVTINPTFSDAGVNDVLIVTYDWGTGFVPENTHTYCAVGDYTVTVRVSDGDSGVVTDTLVVTVANVLHTITSTGEPYIGIVDEVLTFTAEGSDVCSDNLIVEWNFGAGYSGDNTNSWAEPFSGIIDLKITDQYGEVVTSDVQVDIYNYDIELDAGWNLVSIPLVPENDDTSIGTVLNGNENVKVVWSYQQGVWSYFNGANGNLDEIIPGFGYYIDMNEEDTLYLNGERMYGDNEFVVPRPPVVTLTPSWNLIGHYGMVEPLLKDKALDTLAGSYSTLLDKDGISVPDMNPKEGYWLFVTGTDNLDYAPSDEAYA